jgi:uncharacterized protein (TIGR02266 family)
MELQALLLSRDPETLRVLRRVLDEQQLRFEACTTPEQAKASLGKRKVDAVIIDCDDMHGAVDVLKTLRASASGKRSIAFAIINGVTTVPDAFNLGANFVLDKPISYDRASRILRAAHGLMVRERRRYNRNPLPVAMTVTTSTGEQIRGKMINLSEGGLAMHADKTLERNTAVKVQFTLPTARQPFEAKGEVAWIDEKNNIGIRFLNISQNVQRDLEQWLGQQAMVNPPAQVFINATMRGR